MAHSAHIDTFARDHLPPREQWPEFIYDLPELHYPERLNCAVELLDRALERGWGARIALMTPGGLRWTYAELTAKANRIARVLAEDLQLVPGNRVLLRGPNSPMMAACWFAVMKAGGIHAPRNNAAVTDTWRTILAENVLQKGFDLKLLHARPHFLHHRGVRKRSQLASLAHGLDFFRRFEKTHLADDFIGIGDG